MTARATYNGTIIRNRRGEVLHHAELPTLAAVLRDAYRCGANTVGCVLKDADLGSEDLSGLDLRYADLRGADLRGANLRGARLRGADLTDALTEGAVFDDASLDFAIGADELGQRSAGAILTEAA